MTAFNIVDPASFQTAWAVNPSGSSSTASNNAPAACGLPLCYRAVAVRRTSRDRPSNGDPAKSVTPKLAGGDLSKSSAWPPLGPELRADACGGLNGRAFAASTVAALDFAGGGAYINC